MLDDKRRERKFVSQPNWRTCSEMRETNDCKRKGTWCRGLHTGELHNLYSSANYWGHQMKIEMDWTYSTHGHFSWGKSGGGLGLDEGIFFKVCYLTTLWIQSDRMINGCGAAARMRTGTKAEVLAENQARRNYVHHKSHRPDLGCSLGCHGGKTPTNDNINKLINIQFI
jgi:hypothetical protein